MIFNRICESVGGHAILALLGFSFLAGAFLADGLPASAASPASANAAGKTSCTNKSNVLGVSRVVKIDTTDGPRFGLQQYKHNDFLKHKEIVLTFDDGPSRLYTRTILDALDKQCTKATFFMVGQMAKNDPEMVKEVARRGHTVATHTWSHKNLQRRSKIRGIREIELGVSAVSKTLGKPPAPFFRFPYLAGPRRMLDYLKTRKIGVFSIDVDSKDYRTRSGAVVTRKVLRDLKAAGKGIILFHDIHHSTAQALPGLLKKLHQQGYKVVHLVPKAGGATLAKYDGLIAKRFKGSGGSGSSGGTAQNKHNKKPRTLKRASRKKYVKQARSRSHRRKKTYKKTTSSIRPQQWSRDVFHGG